MTKSGADPGFYYGGYPSNPRRSATASPSSPLFVFPLFLCFFFCPSVCLADSTVVVLPHLLFVPISGCPNHTEPVKQERNENQPVLSDTTG